MLRDQHPQDHFGGGPEPAAALALRIAPHDRGDDELDERFVLKRGVDPL